MKKVTFKEEQKFRRWDVIGIISILILGMVFRMLKEFTGAGNVVTEHLLLDSLLLAVLVIGLLVLLNIRLITKIDEKGIRYQMFPLHYKQYKISWEDVKGCQIVETPWTANLSGWGMSVGSRELFYSFYGRTGLQLTLKDGEKVFLGTHQLQTLKDTMEKIKCKLNN